MKVREIRENVYWLGAIDWDRRLFDSLIPLPDGTSYNSYLIKGKEKTVLIDTVDPKMTETLLLQLKDIETIDYIVSHHTEQDHSGAIPAVLKKYPKSIVLATEKGKEMLIDHLLISPEKIQIVEDGEEIPLGDKTLKFIHTPWVHWPETMVSYLVEDKILFSCDFFGSHVATTDLYVRDEGLVYEAAKRYFAEIMMPFSKIIRKNIDKVKKMEIQLIAPSHGPIYDKPSFIVDAYEDWISDTPKNVVVIPYVSMHGSTRTMVEYLVGALVKKDVTVYQFDLAVVDIGKLAITLVDAATVILGTPTVHAGPHPLAVYATYLLNALKPKIKLISV
ncbi:MAG: FprA family A-type flavoprotein, partial [Candidatus Heimdallarchaeota archaeon]|nr:FprA family A-type flavoprotein [Candidatus Heimdallarchaeota archaeon]MCK5144952.1 FprA family A-type flavoprotein [Candidatus Heimdallarchaeota archaeon]